MHEIRTRATSLQMPAVVAHTHNTQHTKTHRSQWDCALMQTKAQNGAKWHRMRKRQRAHQSD